MIRLIRQPNICTALSPTTKKQLEPEINWQHHFAEALLQPDTPLPDVLAEHDNVQQSSRFSVYRNNVTYSLIQALREGFATIELLIGSQQFKNLATAYVRAHPPTSPVLLCFGDKLPDFLQSFTPLGKYPFLADIARVDYARRMSYHSPDFVIGKEQPPQDIGSAVPIVNPSLRFVSSTHPVYDIWKQANNIDKQQEKTAQDIISLRHSDKNTSDALHAKVYVHLLPQNTLAFFIQLTDIVSHEQPDKATSTNKKIHAKTMGDIASAALDQDVNCDISTAMSFALQSKSIIAFTKLYKE